MKKNMLLLIVFISLLFMNSLVACVDVSQQVHYRVDGDGGNLINLDFDDEYLCSERYCGYDCPENSKFIALSGRTKINIDLHFEAIPDDGYKVKEWIVNDQIIEDNVSNLFTINIVYDGDWEPTIIIVRFEKISNDNV